MRTNVATPRKGEARKRWPMRVASEQLLDSIESFTTGTMNLATALTALRIFRLQLRLAILCRRAEREGITMSFITRYVQKEAVSEFTRLLKEFKDAVRHRRQGRVAVTGTAIQSK